MKTTLGIVLCALGVIGLCWGGFRYRTREKMFALGSIQATRQETHEVPFPPILGALALLGGGGLLLANRGKGTQ